MKTFKTSSYIGLARERYNLPIYPVLINILPHVKKPNIPDFYEQEFMGMKSYQDYRVINLWEDLEPLLSFFAAFVLEMPIVQQIMRWDMIVLRESPWYQEILKEGEKRGEQRGETNLVIRQLSKRFGNLDQELAAQIRQLSSPQLETLGESIFDFSAMADLENW